MKDPLIQHGADYKALRRQGLSKECAEKIVLASNLEKQKIGENHFEQLSYENIMELAHLRSIKGIESMSREELIAALRAQSNN
ncbi:hypothetical protein HZR84_01870 [Hyphobacterium sp. CCMP332]|nr:hypothetical protein HZR84_01870 [Hyphobacterium sp. CCMP332]